MPCSFDPSGTVFVQGPQVFKGWGVIFGLVWMAMMSECFLIFGAGLSLAPEILLSFLLCREKWKRWGPLKQTWTSLPTTPLLPPNRMAFLWMTDAA
jgi:hypothetical protein